jgi:hypothetical protein
MPLGHQPVKPFNLEIHKGLSTVEDQSALFKSQIYLDSETHPSDNAFRLPLQSFEGIGHPMVPPFTFRL